MSEVLFFFFFFCGAASQNQQFLQMPNLLYRSRFHLLLPPDMVLVAGKVYSGNQEHWEQRGACNLPLCPGRGQHLGSPVWDDCQHSFLTWCFAFPELLRASSSASMVRETFDDQSVMLMSLQDFRPLFSKVCGSDCQLNKWP